MKDSLLEDREAGYLSHLAPSTSKNKNIEKKMKTTTFGSRDVRMKNMIEGTKNDCGRTENDDCGKLRMILCLATGKMGCVKLTISRAEKLLKNGKPG